MSGQYPPQNPQDINNTRVRKQSKEIMMKNKEKFADLIVVLGIKYDEFIGKLLYSDI